MFKPIVLLLLLITALSVYAGTLDNNFIFDDNIALVNNPYARNLSLLPRVFTRPSGKDYYRPLETLTYTLEYPLWKLSPAGYRMDNILIHALNSFLVFLVIGALLNVRTPALFVAAIFCVHPLNSYMTAVIAGRSHLLEMMFVLLSMLAFINYVSSGKKYAFALSLLSFIPALLSREGAVLLPLYILICAALLGIGLKKTVFCLIPYAAMSAIYLILRSMFLPCDKLIISNLFSLSRISEFIWLAQLYIGQLVLPYDIRVAVFGNSASFRLVFFGFYFAVTAYFLIKALAVKDKFSLAGAMFYFAGILPVINLADVIKLYGSVISETYVYAASIGFFIFIAGLVMDLRRSFNKTALTIFFLIVFFYAGLTVFNNARFRDDLTFYKYVRIVSPSHGFTHVNLAFSFYKRGMYKEAEAEAQPCLSENPGCWWAYLLLGDIAIKRGEPEKAKTMFEKAIFLNPRASEGYNNLGCVYEDQGHADLAIAQFRKAMDLDPEFKDAIYNLAILYEKTGALKEAISLWRQALARDPNDELAQKHMERLQWKYPEKQN